jgi:3-keto-disaccharide hydrolase
MKITPAVVVELTLGMLGLLGFLALDRGGQSLATAAELKFPEVSKVQRFDFEQKGLEGWKTVDGRWTVEDASDAPSGTRVLVQRAVKSAYNVIVVPGGPYTDVDISVRFKPISGREDASGGILFRFSEGRYYLVRANALEDNYRLYYYDRGRYQLATAWVQPPALGRWHTLRVVAVADVIQAYLDSQLLLNHRDSRFRSGQIGLWTKSDSVTAFDDLEIKAASRSK